MAARPHRTPAGEPRIARYQQTAFVASTGERGAGIQDDRRSLLERSNVRRVAVRQLDFGDWSFGGDYKFDGDYNFGD
jgi:hypothetical protein